MDEEMKRKVEALHEGGKIEIVSRIALQSRDELSLAYTPGVAHISKLLAENKERAYNYTRKWNAVAIVSDGSAVLGMGNIGAYGAIPVMEGKAVLFKELGDVDAFPICLATQVDDEIIKIVEAISPVFGGINLEDIAAPHCFRIEKELENRLDIPVFHDDQHGTAIVVLAALMNALKLVGKDKNVKVVISGAGAAGIAITKLLLDYGIKHIVVCDSRGIIHEGRNDLNFAKEEIAKLTNPEKLEGDLALAMKGADVFIGVSAPNIVSKEMVESMNDDAIVFAMANPVPEIMPDEAKKAGARIVGTGRSDFPNQINNALAFPGVFRGALDVRARRITKEMKIAAARAIANYAENLGLSEERIVPKVLDRNVHNEVARAVREAAMKCGVARKK